MRFISKFPGTATSIDPRTAPANILLDRVFIVEPSLLNTGIAPRKVLVGLEGTAANTATVQFWVLDDSGFSSTDTFDPSTALWYSIGAVVVATVGEVVDGPALPGGRIYVEVTVASAAPSVIKVGSAP